MKGNINISVNSNATDISACVYMWTAVMIRRESRRNRKLYSQTSLLCFVVCAEFSCPAKCAELCRRKSRLMKEIVAKLKQEQQQLHKALEGITGFPVTHSLPYSLNLLHTLSLCV